MKKTILAAAVAAAVMAAPMTAAANVVIYGKIHASLDYVSQNDYFALVPEYDLKGNLAGYEFDAFEGNDNWEVTSRTTRIGFKGSEDLGNGLKAIWKVEIGYDLDDGGWEAAGRNSYIGLAGDWGTFLVGKHDTPLKISTGRLDVFADTMADYNTTLGFVDRRASNVIAYISPNWNGFTFAVAGVAAEDYSGDIGDGGYSIAAMYFNNGFYASLAWEDVGSVGDTKFGSFPVGSVVDNVNDNDSWRVGLGYIMNAFTFGVVYEQQSINFDIDDGFDVFTFDGEIDKWMVSGAYDFGNNTVKAMYGQYGFDDDDAEAWAIGFDHKLSVRTKVYALYADSDLGLHNHPATQIFLQRVPGDERVEGATTPIAVGGNGFSMGMVHTF